MFTELKKLVEDGLPIYAECGGLLYLLESISVTAPCVALDRCSRRDSTSPILGVVPPASMQSTNKAGEYGNMVGLVPGRAVMQNRLQGLGYQSAPMPGGILRSHTFHHSTIETSLDPIAYGERLHNTSPGEAIFRINKLTASYLHCYFASNPAAAVQLFLN